jgi:nucleotide-binding universal stress UspA family protein
MTTQRNRMPVVVGVDGSPATVDAVRWAAAQALRDDLSLRLVHAYELPIGFPTGVAEEEAVLVAVREQGRGWLADAAAVAAEALTAERVETALTAAATAASLLRESETASMVVLGNKGRNLLTGMLAGSTFVAVAGHAQCRVVLVRGTAPAGPVVDGTPASEPVIALRVRRGVGARRGTGRVARLSRLGVRQRARGQRRAAGLRPGPAGGRGGAGGITGRVAGEVPGRHGAA